MKQEDAASWSLLLYEAASRNADVSWSDIVFLHRWFPSHTVWWLMVAENRSGDAVWTTRWRTLPRLKVNWACRFSFDRPIQTPELALVKAIIQGPDTGDPDDDWYESVRPPTDRLTRTGGLKVR